MPENKTQAITLPSGTVVEMKTVLTAGDFIDANDTPNGVELTKIQLSKKLMDQSVVSIGGVTTDIPNGLRALALADYTFLSKEVTKLIQGDFTKAETL